MTQIARCDWLPERARWGHLASSGLPAVSRKKNVLESHIINPLLTKFVWSRWLDIGLVLFLRVDVPRLRLGHNHNRNLNLNRYRNRNHKQLLDEAFVISRIIKVEIRVISRSRRLRLIT